MAEVRVVTIKADLSDAKKQFDDLTAVLNEQKKITLEFERELLTLNQRLAESGSATEKVFLKGKITEVNNALKDQRFAVKDLTSQRSQLGEVIKSNTQQEGISQIALEALNEITGGFSTKIYNLRGAFMGAITAAKGFIGSLTGIKAALISTGIGALVVALGSIVAYWEDITALITGVNKKLEDQVALSNRLVEIDDARLSYLTKRLEQSGKEGQVDEGLLLRKKELLKTKLKDLRASQELTREQLRQASIAAQTRGLFDFTTTTTEEQQKVLDLKKSLYDINLKILQTEDDLKGENVEKYTPEDEEGDRKKKAEEAKQLAERAAEKAKKKAEEEAKKSKQKPYEDAFEARSQQLSIQVQAAGFAKRRAQKEAYTAWEENQQAQADARAKAAAQAQADFEKSLDDENFKAKMSLFEAVGQGLQQLSLLAGQQTAEGKALAVAAALISTYQGIAATLREGGIASIIQSVVVGLAGFNAVKNILAVKVPGGDSGGGGNSGRASTAPPTFNVVQSSANNQLQRAVLNNSSNPVRAFVVDSDVTTAQELKRKKIQASSLK